MNRRLISLGLGVVLATSLVAPALAFEQVAPLSAPLRYAYSITVNGTPLDLTRLPGSDGVPLRAIAESDYGSAAWFESEQSGSFYFGKDMITVDFKDNSISVKNEKLPDVTATVIDGVTFAPISVLSKLDGYKVEEVADTALINIVTKNNDPMVKFARETMEAMDMGNGMLADAEYMEGLNLSAKNFTECVGFFPMMISPNTLFVGKLAPDVKPADVEAEFEAYRLVQEKTFEWYLPQNQPKVKNAKFVINGEYVLFVIGGEYKDPNFDDPNFPENPITTEIAVERFNAFVKAQTAA